MLKIQTQLEEKGVGVTDSRGSAPRPARDADPPSPAAKAAETSMTQVMNRWRPTFRRCRTC